MSPDMLRKARQSTLSRAHLLVANLSVIAAGCVTPKSYHLPSESGISGNFAPEWKEEVLFAYEHFSKDRSDMSCFILDTQESDKFRHVAFALPLKWRMEGEAVIIPDRSGPRCGGSRVYEFDKSGKFIRWYNIH